MPPILTTKLVKDGREIKVNTDQVLEFVSNGWDRVEIPKEDDSVLENANDLEAEEKEGDKVEEPKEVIEEPKVETPVEEATVRELIEEPKAKVKDEEEIIIPE